MRDDDTSSAGKHSLNLSHQFVATGTYSPSPLFPESLRTRRSKFNGSWSRHRHKFRRVIKIDKAACMPHPVFGINIPLGDRDRASYCSCAHVLGIDLNRTNR
ncbi:hypothetical protein CEXT_383561 [Caerostris extrusa]|uniref:Uncharacterized protein n=1 Tax=Caerostris extrusa TaxID=172846 RepID=A0AAV4SR64_CAEEX|nr:hypothetical protein CEXT_383561 [Caerostris extrusa]